MKSSLIAIMIILIIPISGVSQCDHEIFYENTNCDGTLEAGTAIIFTTDGEANGIGFWNIGDGLFTLEMPWWEYDDFTFEYTFEEPGIYSVFFSFETTSGCTSEDSISIEINEATQESFLPDYLGSNPEWCTTKYESECSNCFVCTTKRTYYIGGDTIFNDVDFKILYAYGIDFGCGSIDYIQPYIETYMRQESEVIYRYYPELDSTIVMYDFSLQLGDTIPPGGIYNNLFTGDQLFPEAVGVYTISDVDSICFNGSFYKKFTFSTPYPFAGSAQIIYEGMGHIHGPVYPFREMGEFESMNLNVFRINNETLFGNGNYICDYNLSIDELDGNNTFNIYPNPTKENLVITIPKNSVSTFNLRILDVNGKEILYMANFSNEQSLDVSSLNPGMYFLQVELESGNFMIKKFIKN